MRSRRWVILIPVAMILLAVPSLYLLLGLQASFESYKPSRPPAALPDAVNPPYSSAPASGVVLVVIDGLREDTSDKMPYLNQLRESGAYGAMRSGQPSFSKPSYAVISSGAWQESTGIVLNSSVGPTPVDTIFRSARRSGLTVAMDAHEWWEEVNMPGAFTTVQKYGDDQSHNPGIDFLVRDRAVQVLTTDKPPDLTLVHFTWVDTQGHNAGAGSKEYLDAAWAADMHLKDVVRAMDLSRQTLIITADHGHLSHNNGGGSGHGGWEPETTTVPFVMIGAGIKAGAVSGLQQIDVAPTVAALLGISVPADAQGHILWDALAVPGQYRTLYDAADQARLTAAESNAVARAARLPSERMVRAVIVLVVLALVGFALSRLVWSTRRILLVSAASYPAVYWLTYTGLFKSPFSLAAFPDASILTFVRIICIPTAISMVILYAVLARARAFSGNGGLPAAVETVTAGAMLGMALVYAVGYVANGSKVTWCLPDFLLGFLQLSALLQFSLVGIIGWIPPLVAAGISRARSRSGGSTAR